jgi:hypothetical protein
MAVIGTIRKRSGLLIFLIGLSIVGFLIMDATNSQGSLLKGRKDSVGKVNGEKIAYTEFSKKYEDNLKNAEDQMRGQPMGDDQRNYVRTQTWTEMVNDIIFKKVYDKLGINVTGDEMSELATGENASPYIKNDQQFKNPQTGQFDPAQVRMYLTRLDQDPEGVEPGTVRKLQYVTFDIVPSAGDTARTVQSLVEKRAEFAAGAKAADDSVFVKLYSETPFDETYYDKDKLFSSVKDSFFTYPVKSIVGPYIDGKSVKLAKISDRKMISDSVHVREIVLSFAGVTSQELANV